MVGVPRGMPPVRPYWRDVSIRHRRWKVARRLGWGDRWTRAVLMHRVGLLGDTLPLLPFPSTPAPLHPTRTPIEPIRVTNSREIAKLRHYPDSENRLGT